MKKLILLYFLLLLSSIGFSQHLTGTDIRLINGDSVLSGTGNGTIFYNRVSNKFRFRQNGSWVSLGSGSGSGGTTDYNRTINVKTGDYILTVTDSAKLIRMNVAISNTVTIPPHSSVPFKVRTVIPIMWYGVGQTALVAGAGVTIDQQSGNLALPGQYSVVLVTQIAIDEWVLTNGPPAYVSPLSLLPQAIGFLITGGTTSKTLTVLLDATVSGTNTGDQTLTGLSYWNIGSNTTLTNPVTIIQTSTNYTTFKIDALGTTLTGAPGMRLINTTAAAVGAQQISPFFILGGNGWKTTATAASQEVLWAQYVLPVQGTTNPTANLNFLSIINGSASINPVVIIKSTGQLQTIGSGTTNASASFNATNSSQNSVLTAYDDGQVGVNGTLFMFPQNTDATTTSTLGAKSWHFFNNNTSLTNQSAFVFQANTMGPTANPYYGLQLITSFSPTSGNASFDGVSLQYTINQTSTASGTVGALLYNPTLTGVLGTHYGIRIVPIGALSSFGTSLPNSTVHINGSLATAYIAKTALYTLTANDHTVEVTSGTHTQTLPTAVGITGREYFITNSGSGVTTIGTTSSQTFVNVVATPTTLTLAQFKWALVKSNGANWIVMSSN